MVGVPLPIGSIERDSAFVSLTEPLPCLVQMMLRRITANWVEYAGGMIYGKADHRRSKGIMPEDITVDHERAVFDIEMCLMVGKLRYERARNHKGSIAHSAHIDAKSYPLSKLVYCAHCERVAIERGDVHERTYLTGRTGSSVTIRRYRHDTERRCPSQKRSVKAEVIEADFVRLLKSITINPDAMPLIMQALDSINGSDDNSGREQVIQAEIVHWRQAQQKRRCAVLSGANQLKKNGINSSRKRSPKLLDCKPN